ncbi:hypothetical protein Dimus_003653, partial [Dionaea muscipula]
MIPTPTGPSAAKQPQIQDRDVSTKTGLAIVPYVAPQLEKEVGTVPAAHAEGEKVSKKRKSPQTVAATTKK